MAPALTLLMAFTYWPFARSIQFSLFLVDRNTFELGRSSVGATTSASLTSVREPSATIGSGSILSSFEFTLLVVPLTLGSALILALLAFAKVKGSAVFRTLFLTTLSIAVASAAVIWSLLYSPNLKLFEHVLTDASTALFAVAVMTVWANLGFAFILLLAGLQAIPKELWESSRIDGANPWLTFRRIALPMLSPTLLFLLITTTVASFQAFTQFKVLIDSPGPEQSTNVLVYALFTAFWVETNYGFAAALSVILFLLLIGLSLWQYKLDSRVHYQ